MSTIHEMISIAGSFDQAEVSAKKYIKEKGPEFLLDLALLYSWRGKIAQSWECIEEATKIFPEDDRVAYNRGWHLLLQGKFYEGYTLMNRARNVGLWSKNNISLKPKWNGSQDVRNKHVLFYTEAGFGDEIAYIRFAQEIASLGAKVTVIASSGMIPIFARIPEISCSIARKPNDGEQSGNFAISQEIYHDYWIPSLSAPVALKTEWGDLKGEPYLTPHPGYVKKFVHYTKTDKLKVGIRWLGRSGPDYENRIFPREQLFEAVSQDHVQLYSLQKDCSQDSLPGRIIDLEIVLDTFEDLAGAIANLDIIITSCTAIAHLSAAMGKPTYIVVPIMPYVTWTYPGNKTPWYNSAELFRQRVFANWDHPFQKIRERLKNFKKGRKTNVRRNLTIV